MCLFNLDCCTSSQTFKIEEDVFDVPVYIICLFRLVASI
jgi:hypothetical protein